MSVSDFPAVLSAQSLTMRFGGLVALDALDLHVERGNILGLIGPNGSGKTTFFNVVTGIYAPSDGRIEFAGTDLTRATAQEVYRAGIARTFQRSRLCLSLSIFDNIMIGNHKGLNHRILFNLVNRRGLKAEFEQCFERARDLVRTFDAPLADRLFEPVAAFPMIDRRRIEICRALISNPSLLLLDEPSAGMTGEETRQLMDNILAVRDKLENLTIVVVEHEMNVIERITDRCVVLNFGRKIAEGTYAGISRDPMVQQAYLGVE